MNKEKKIYRLWWFGILQCEQAEAWLEDLAQQGWMLKSIGNWFASFEQCEPTALRYACVVRRDFFDAQEEEDIKKAFAEASWNYIDYHEKMLVFYAPKNAERPKPLKPAPRSSLRDQLLSIILSIIVFTIITALYVVLIFIHKFPIRYPLQGDIGLESIIFVSLFFFTLFCTFALQLAEQIRKFRRSKKPETEAFVEKEEFRNTILLNRVYRILSILAFVFFFASKSVNL